MAHRALIYIFAKRRYVDGGGNVVAGFFAVLVSGFFFVRAAPFLRDLCAAVVRAAAVGGAAVECFFRAEFVAFVEWGRLTARCFTAEPVRRPRALREPAR